MSACEHGEKGLMPCPWPGCQQGIPEQVLVTVSQSEMVKHPGNPSLWQTRWERIAWREGNNQPHGFTWEIEGRYATKDTSR